MKKTGKALTVASLAATLALIGFAAASRDIRGRKTVAVDGETRF